MSDPIVPRVEVTSSGELRVLERASLLERALRPLQHVGYRVAVASLALFMLGAIALLRGVPDKAGSRFKVDFPT